MIEDQDPMHRSFRFAGSTLAFALSLAAASFLPASSADAKSNSEKGEAHTGKQTAKSRKAAEDQKAKQAKSAATEGAQSLGTFGDWGAYTGGQASKKVCFVLSQPKERLPKGLNRDPAYIFISFRPAQGVKNEIAVTTGYALKTGDDPVVTLGKTKFTMVAKDSNAFLRNAAEESQFVELSKHASTLTIKGMSTRNHETVDRYSLAGFTQALDRAAKECQ